MSDLVGGPGEEPPDAGEVFKFCKKSLEKLQNMHYFSLFFQKFSKVCVKRLRVWTKRTLGCDIFEKNFFDENPIEKFNFFLFFGKVLAKNGAFGNNISYGAFKPRGWV